MSGIVGFNWDNSFLVRKMCQSIKHRGPDQESFFSDSNVSLGHNKLWLPVDKAKYPIKNEDNSIFLVADARVYNHQELRKDLEKKGHKFSTQSDNEVIVHAYEEYGDECVQLFNGQFAFCIYDGRQKKFLLARDRAGIRPLYYYWKDGKFIFASELKAILEHDVKREIDIESIRFYLSHGVVPCPRSIFNDIYKLSPANMMIVKDGQVKIHTYWDIDYSVKLDDNEEVLALRLRDQFEQAIERRLIEGQEAGAFLSGGVDSSSVAAVLKSKFVPDLKTFGVKFDHEKFDESPDAQRMIDLLNLDHTFIPFNGEIGLKLIPKLAFLYDEPFADSSMLATHYVSDYASKHVKVVFCGDGGDELFAGYDRYPWIMNVVLPKVLPKFVAPLFINPVAGVFEKINYHPIFYKLGKHMRALAQPPYVRYEDILSFGDKKVRSEYSMLGVTSYYDLYRSYWQYPEELNNLMNIDWHQELHDDGLVKVDRASMGASIETAMPILDHSFVDYATKIPAGLKLKNGDKKYIFKMAMKDMLPLEIWKKKKHGFGVPVTEYFKKDWESYVHDTLLSNEFLSKPYLNQNGVRKIIEVHKSGKEDYSPAIWLFLMLEEFLKKWSY